MMMGKKKCAGKDGKNMKSKMPVDAKAMPARMADNLMMIAKKRRGGR